MLLAVGSQHVAGSGPLFRVLSLSCPWVEQLAVKLRLAWWCHGTVKALQCHVLWQCGSVSDGTGRTRREVCLVRLPLLGRGMRRLGSHMGDLCQNV